MYVGARLVISAAGACMSRVEPLYTPSCHLMATYLTAPLRKLPSKFYRATFAQQLWFSSHVSVLQSCAGTLFCTAMTQTSQLLTVHR